MKYKFTYKLGKLAADEYEFFEKVNPGYKVTGDTLEEHYEEINGLDEGGTTYVIMKGKFTRYGMCRDLGDHYIIARWARYDRIDKKTLKRIIDVEDK